MISVLTFHAVTDGDWFEDLICWLKRRYRLVPIDIVSRFYTDVTDVGHACHITVDDGDRSFADIIFPTLVRHNVPASLFVSPKMCVENRNFWFQEIKGYRESTLRSILATVVNVPIVLLTHFSVDSILKTLPLHQINEVIRRYQESTGTTEKARQNISVCALKEIAASGLVTIGAHTMSHPILSNEDDATCEDEIARSVRDLSTLLGRPIRHFAYPNGIPGVDLGEREALVLRNAGIRMAFTTESRHLSATDNELRIPRLGVSDMETTRFVTAKMLLGSNWNRLKTIVGTGEDVERRRLSRALRCFRDSVTN